MKIVQKDNKQLKIADERLEDMLGRGYSEVDQKTGKVIPKKNAKTDDAAELKKENVELKKEVAALKKENAALKEQMETQNKSAV